MPYLKRLFDENMKPAGVEVLRMGNEWNVSPELVAKGTKDGWLSMTSGELILHDSKTKTDIRFDILQTPGCYCCYCGLECDNGGEAKSHIDSKHKGLSSPDQNNPAGYKIIHHFACVRKGVE